MQDHYDHCCEPNVKVMVKGLWSIYLVQVWGPELGMTKVGLRVEEGWLRIKPNGLLVKAFLIRGDGFISRV